MTDYTLADTLHIAFTTRAFATGIPTVLAGTPVVSAYEDASLTQITAGITLGVDHDSVVGLNMLTIVATGANGYEAGKDYNLVITTGTVGGISVIGEVVGRFTLARSAAAVDLANATDGLTALAADIATAQADLDTITGAAGALLDTTATSAQLVDDVWDEVLTGATHNVATSSGRRLRQLEASFVITAGTAQAGTANTITLAAGESATDDIFQGDRVIIVAGTGIEEHGIITVYNGTTKVATMSQNWVITPDATSEYELSPADVDVETWQHVSVTSSSTTNLPEVDAKSISDSTAAADAITEARLAELDAGNLPTDIAAVKVDTAAILVDTDATIPGLIAALNDLAASDILTTVLVESYAADGSTGTLTQILYLIQQSLHEFAIASTTRTVKKLDGAATAATFTLDDDTNPTSTTRAT